jgi:hypothetical protein
LLIFAGLAFADLYQRTVDRFRMTSRVVRPSKL